MPRPVRAVRKAFDREALREVCQMHEDDFPDAYELETVAVPQSPPDDVYYFKDNGSNILAVAHLDTVQPHHKRTCNYLDTAGGPVVYSGALDDRLGAYIILDLLPALGITHDILLTVGEESGRSTAAHFEPDPGKEYDWMIEFDRGGTDVVMYQYDDEATREAVRSCGARVGEGIFSDIAYLEHLEIKGFNWGVGYRDYHSPRSHAYLDDTYDMVAKYVRFHGTYGDIYMPHEGSDGYFGIGRSPRWDSFSWSYDDEPSADIVDAEIVDDDFSEYPTQEEIRRALDAMEKGMAQ